MNTELDVLAERFVKLGEVILVFSNLAEVHGLLDQVLANDLEDLVLLKGLTGDVEREILGVDDSFHEVKVWCILQKWPDDGLDSVNSQT